MAVQKRLTSTSLDESNAHLESRVGRLEGVLDNFAQELKATGQSVREISNSLSNFEKDILGKLGTATTPKTSIIFTYATLLITIMGLCGTIVAIMISGQRDSIETIKAQQMNIQQVEANNKLEDGKNMMWRELVNNFMQEDVLKDKEAIKALEDKILTTYTGKFNNLEELVLTLRNWRLEHVEQNSKFTGEVLSKLKILEILINKIETNQNTDRSTRLNRLEDNNARSR